MSYKLSFIEKNSVDETQTDDAIENVNSALTSETEEGDFKCHENIFTIIFNAKSWSKKNYIFEKIWHNWHFDRILVKSLNINKAK